MEEVVPRCSSSAHATKEMEHPKSRNVKVNDFVIVADQNPLTEKWNVGRILRVFAGTDGLVRNVEVKTASGTYTRPITKICIIYPAEGFADYNGDSPLRGGMHR